MKYKPYLCVKSDERHLASGMFITKLFELFNDRCLYTLQSRQIPNLSISRRRSTTTALQCWLNDK